MKNFIIARMPFYELLFYEKLDFLQLKKASFSKILNNI